MDLRIDLPYRVRGIINNCIPDNMNLGKMNYHISEPVSRAGPRFCIDKRADGLFSEGDRLDPTERHFMWSNFEFSPSKKEILVQKPLSEALFCAVDVETSGLSASSRVVEIGAVLFNLKGKISTFQTLVNPHERISPGVQEIHGISNEMVKNAPSAGEVLPRFLDFMTGSVMIAHNASFDVMMLSSEMERVGLTQPDHPVICTVKLAKSVFTGPENYRLSTLIKYLKIDYQRLHRGLDDAIAAMEVFRKATQRFSPRTQVRALPGFEGLFAQMGVPPWRNLEIKGTVEELDYLASMRIPIELEYASSRYPQPTIVTPVRVYTKLNKRYLLAYCHRDGIEKTYLVNKIKSLRRA